MMPAVVIGVAIAGSLALTPLAKALAWKLDAVSRPDGNRKLHCRPTPLLGGGPVYLALLPGLIVAYWVAAGDGSIFSLPIALALSAGILCVLGCYDDLVDMRARWKLCGQIISTLPIVLAGGCIKGLVLFGYPIELGWWGVIFTIGWLVLGINALNLLDGMDGLASVIGIAIALAIALIAATQARPAVMLLALALAGALAGFLVYNLPPARIYLGDCGSMIIGVTLALLALRVSLVGQTTTANLTVAAALMFVPLIDTGLAIVRRSLMGNGLMVADRGHIHHQLASRGFNTWKVLGFLGGLCLTAGAVAWLVASSGQEFWAWAILGTITVLAVNRRFLGHEEWRLAKRFVAQTTARLLRQPLPERTPGTLRIFPPSSTPPPLANHENRGVAQAGQLPGEPALAAENSKKAA